MTDAPADSSDLDALVARIDPDRWLSSRFIADPEARADVVAIYAYDHELARAPRVASNSLLGEIRLTWWHEALDEVFEGRPVRHHPVAQVLAGVVARRSLPRAPLEAMIDARYRELDATPMSRAEALDWARDTGGQAAVLAALILDPACEAQAALPAGTAWALSHKIGGGGAEPETAAALPDLMLKARAGARLLSVAAFPAAAHAALARTRAAGRRPTALAARMALLRAVMFARI